MSRREPYVVSFRVDEYAMERLMQFAMDNGLINADDQPNISAACKLLISMAFEDFNSQEATMHMYKIARAAVLTEVKKNLNQLMAQLASQV